MNIDNKIILNSKLNVYEKMFLLIVSNSNENKSIEDIAELIPCCYSKLTGTIKTLRESNIISVVNNRSNGKRDNNQYTINLEMLKQ